MLSCKLEACAKRRENSQEWGRLPHPNLPTPQVVVGREGFRPDSSVKEAGLGLAGPNGRGRSPASALGKASAPSSGCTEVNPASS